MCGRVWTQGEYKAMLCVFNLPLHSQSPPTWFFMPRIPRQDIRPRYQDILPPQDMSTDWTSDPDYSYSVFHEEHRGQDDEAQNDPYPAPQHSFEANPANSPCPTDGFSIIQPCSFPPYNPHGYSQSPRQPHSYTTLASPSPVSFHPHSSGSESSSPGLYHPQPNLNRRQLSPHDFYYPNALGQNPQASPSFSTVRPLTANTPPVYDYDQTDFSLVIYNQPQTPEAHTNRSVHTHHDQLRFFKNTPLESGHAHLFVPQKMYKPHTNSDRRRYVEEVGLEPPILFLSDDPANHGISLSDALHSRVKNLLHREEQVFQDRGPSVSIRLEWAGYGQWSRQIPTKDFRSPPCPITRAKLAKNVAKCVSRFMEETRGHAMDEEADHRWKIGNRPEEIRFDDLVLVSLHHVSMGSWQPHLRLRHAAGLSK